MSKKAITPTVEEAPVKPKKKLRDILNIVINVILVLAIALAALCTYVSFVSGSGNGVPTLFGYEVFSVQTDSMYPTLKPGDLVIDRVMKDASQLRKGDIITYWTVIEGERVLNTHRINKVYDGGSYLIFETKGDKNSVADTLTVHEAEVVGVYATHIGGLGKVLDYLQTSTGFLLVIVIPVALFFIFHLIQFFRVLFEYQNIKSRLKYQEELDERDAGAGQTPEPGTAVVDKAAIEAELREQLKAEMMAQMLAEMKKQNAASEADAEAEAPAEEAVPTEEAPVGEESHAEAEAPAGEQAQ